MIAYCRVSTGDQANNGHGLDAQRASIERARDDITTWIEDAAQSAKDLKRPGLTYALELLGTGREPGIVVSKLDRLSRSVGDFADLVSRAQREHWTIVVLDLNLDLSTPMGEAMANMACVFAQLERRMIGQRTREGLAAASRKGVVLGRPKGTGGSKPRVPADVARRMLREREQGATLREIAARLNEDQVPTALGGREWYPATVRNVLARSTVPSVGS